MKFIPHDIGTHLVTSHNGQPNKRVRPIRKVEPQIPDPTANDDIRLALQAAARNTNCQTSVV
jgi:hypothetical protein